MKKFFIIFAILCGCSDPGMSDKEIIKYMSSKDTNTTKVDTTCQECEQKPLIFKPLYMWKDDVCIENTFEFEFIGDSIFRVNEKEFKIIQNNGELFVVGSPVEVVFQKIVIGDDDLRIGSIIFNNTPRFRKYIVKKGDTKSVLIDKLHKLGCPLNKIPQIPIVGTVIYY